MFTRFLGKNGPVSFSSKRRVRVGNLAEPARLAGPPARWTATGFPAGPPLWQLNISSLRRLVCSILEGGYRRTIRTRNPWNLLSISSGKWVLPMPKLTSFASLTTRSTLVRGTEIIRSTESRSVRVCRAQRPRLAVSKPLMFYGPNPAADTPNWLRSICYP